MCLFKKILKNEYKYVKPLKDISLIYEFEKLADFTFDETFRNHILKNNAGYPVKDCFKTKMGKERTVKSFLSFNKRDKENIWKTYDYCKRRLSNIFIPVAIDNFGNYICVERKTRTINFMNLETLTVEAIAKDFEEFFDKLYEA